MPTILEVFNLTLDIIVYPFIWRPVVRSYTSSISSVSPKNDPTSSLHLNPAQTQTSDKVYVEPEYDQTVWAPVTLTLVEYPKDDSVGFVYASASLAPLVIIIALVTLILFRRDLWTVSFS